MLKIATKVALNNCQTILAVFVAKFIHKNRVYLGTGEHAVWSTKHQI
jgi:hypothetical protein